MLILGGDGGGIDKNSTSEKKAPEPSIVLIRIYLVCTSFKLKVKYEVVLSWEL